MVSKRNKPSQVRNRKRRIKAKRPKGESGASPGSAQLDKVTLIEGALPAPVENALIGKMIAHDRVIWPVTEEIKVKAVERTNRLLDSIDPQAVNGATRNLLTMEGQNLKALESPAITQNNTQINVQVNGPPPAVELTDDTRLARIRFILAERRRLEEVARLAERGGQGEDGSGAAGNDASALGASARTADDGLPERSG